MNRNVITLAGLIGLLGATTIASADTLGLYFSDTQFDADTAACEGLPPNYSTTAYIVLTQASGSTVAGYEVGIASSAPDFSIFMLGWENQGTPYNQLVHFVSPKPVLPGGTVLYAIIIFTGSAECQTISFGPAVPPSLPDGLPVVDYVDVGLRSCGYPFGSPVVATVNCGPVADATTAWGDVKALFE